MTDTTTTTTTTTTPLTLVDLVQLTGVGIQMIQMLQYSDVQRLACTAKPFATLLLLHPHSSMGQVVLWLRDVQLLDYVPCASSTLSTKLVQALYERTVRILSYEDGGHVRPEPLPNVTTLYDVYNQSWSYRFFGTSKPFSFQTVHSLDLEEWELEPGTAFETQVDTTKQDIHDDDDKLDTDPNHIVHHPNKRQRRNNLLECSSSSCHDRYVERVYYVNGSPYCGACMDTSCKLKLCFCVEHYHVHNTDWSLSEPSYTDATDTPEFWGLHESEFWVRLWYTQPYNSGELRLIGQGPRAR